MPTYTINADVIINEDIDNMFAIDENDATQMAKDYLMDIYPEAEQIKVNNIEVKSLD